MSTVQKNNTKLINEKLKLAPNTKELHSDLPQLAIDYPQKERINSAENQANTTSFQNSDDDCLSRRRPNFEEPASFA